MNAPPLLVTFEGATPRTHPSTWIAPNATVIGDVDLGPDACIFYGAVLRGDLDRISIGPGSNIQDQVTVHVDPGYPVSVGAGVSVGHGVVLHGCTIDDGCLIGMGATVLNGATIGAQSLVAAGAVVLAGTAVPPRSLVAGVPAKVRRRLGEDELPGLKENADIYLDLAARHRRACPE